MRWSREWALQRTQRKEYSTKALRPALAVRMRPPFSGAMDRVEVL